MSCGSCGGATLPVTALSGLIEPEARVSLCETCLAGLVVEKAAIGDEPNKAELVFNARLLEEEIWRAGESVYRLKPIHRSASPRRP